MLQDGGPVMVVKNERPRAKRRGSALSVAACALLQKRRTQSPAYVVV